MTVMSFDVSSTHSSPLLKSEAPQVAPRHSSTPDIGSRFKLLKACDFCRKRKIKCTILNGKCESCKEHKKECKFGHIQIQGQKVNKPKRRQKIPQPNVAGSITNNSKNLSNYTGTFLDQIDPFVMEEYNRAIDHPIQSSPAFNDFIYPTNRSLQETYIKNIEPYTPFLPLEVFNEELSRFAKCCINISSVSSMNNKLPDAVRESFISMLLEDLSTGDVHWDIMNLSCFFLLPTRIVVPRDIVAKALHIFNGLYSRNPDISLNVIAGALSTDAWHSLFTESPLLTDVNVSYKCYKILRTMDIQNFNYQFMNVNLFLYKLLWIKHDTLMSYEEKKDELLHFEFQMLLFPANLSKNLTVVTDTLLSTPEAFLLHILHNVLMIAYYTMTVTDSEYGEPTSITAVPGLYHFISGMAISNFRVIDDIVSRWTVIADSQIFTAKLLLQLYNIMEFDTFSFTLQFYTRRPNSNFSSQEYEPVDNEVSKVIQNAIRERDDTFDGNVVFWVFRDVRSMSLQLYIDDRKRRGSELSELSL